MRLSESTRSWPVTGVLYPDLIKVHLEEYLGAKPPVLLRLSVCHCVPVRYLTPDHLQFPQFLPPGSKFLSGGFHPRHNKLA
ncbi:hypothetical protein AMECASPLE_012740 [Ameca splendens]|uniref:Uncharacterized protein n=1 Tax=Ameca splendens TaxID=208324 RepID=A0ABV0ZX07_9TELE